MKGDPAKPEGEQAENRNGETQDQAQKAHDDKIQHEGAETARKHPLDEGVVRALCNKQGMAHALTLRFVEDNKQEL